MKNNLIHLERVLGKKVYDSAGKYAGRIEEIIGDNTGAYGEIQEYLLGRVALFDRLSIATLSREIVRLLGARMSVASHRVPWRQMDLTDPEHPRLKCPADQLEPIEP
jgi:sporulation protein YlmC with PRC-barrel domain